MEDTHGAFSISNFSLFTPVLILIVMEDTHGDMKTSMAYITFSIVLILIVMEDTHGDVAESTQAQATAQGLNPYCNGRYSWSKRKLLHKKLLLGLNPYCNGRYSWSTRQYPESNVYFFVLILIVMEDTHGVWHYLWLTMDQQLS